VVLDLWNIQALATASAEHRQSRLEQYSAAVSSDLLGSPDVCDSVNVALRSVKCADRSRCLKLQRR
jgi:hypothetical protein